MITFTKFILLILVSCFSVVFVTSLVYSIRLIFDGNIGYMDIALALNSLYWSAGFIFGAIIIATSGFGDRIAGLFFPIREMSLREETKVNSAMVKIKEAYSKKYGKDIKARILVMDLPNINGLALGSETIAVSTGLLKTANDNEMAAVLAHEIGHLHNKDGLFNMALIMASIPTIILNLLLSGFFTSDESSSSSSKDGGSLIFGIILLFLFLLFFGYFVFF